MTKSQKLFLFISRVALGGLFFYAGITKVLDPNWSAGGYIKGAKHFVGFYNWLAQPGILPSVNFLNKWGLTILGICLIFGIFVRLSSVLGVLVMLLYYFVLSFPYPDKNSFIIDEHIILASVLLFFAAIRAGRIWGLDNWCSHLPICSKFPKLRKILG